MPGLPIVRSDRSEFNSIADSMIQGVNQRLGTAAFAGLATAQRLDPDACRREQPI
jgi:hypothetical protein